ncbi:DUF962 domain-containing protein [Marilutibacter chinensis]|uniref:DUF962 domain-containing protein n=1 Tax=Marilutibacter chinensis TaxID=2912247 RepID=A0ABS9HS63_9GAMM|nr:Mpo1-like protein [Lysobacter chinensis]MCF7221351.1 DUF962 domain-containing protein [Lysobacter chinensis]
MSTATDTSREPAATQRPIDTWFAHYSGDHRNATNQLIHVICVPAILWSVIALLWCIPSPGTWFRAGFWAGAAMFATWAFYYRASRRLALGMLAVFVLMAWLTRWLHDSYGTMNLLYLAIGVFVVAWIGQFVGHSKLFEGKRPSFLTDLRYLLIGPAWVLAKLYRRLGWRY